ncbi:MAG TPA: alkyl sulfatase dimerization domain-containing protein [Rhizomicrobium sp.]|jgi:alkyl sulfatase BDS1-like metallo-beta-lactamase superfamily hydrolase|nr:alkyl sulfatase dimerization domain-containing protein [Rhizomicrobium sp.]
MSKQDAIFPPWRRAAFGICAVAVLAMGDAQAQVTKDAQPDVARANQAVETQLPFADRQDFEDATKGFIATVPDPSGQDRYAFLKGDAPPTVNPSLWRETQLDAINGLFKVADGVYQIRGLSVAAMTVVEGKTGVIVIDTLASPGEAKTALALYFAHRPRRAVKAVIYTHNHGDHYGGASAVVSPQDAASGKVRVIAPAGFMPALIQEASTAANLAGRRGQFQFGGGLPLGATGSLEYGEGVVTSRGAPGPGPIIPPNDTIRKAFESRTIDGVNFVFQLALDTEAPSEMFVYLPNQHVLDMAEDDTHTLHNLLPLRGTLVRNALSWSAALNQALDHFGGDVEILINQHQWPVFGNARVRASLEDHRDLYKYIHDQTLRLMNDGMGPADIAEKLTMPPGLEREWALRGYYGTLPQDARAVYQRYVGWYDGNPANLHPLPPAEEARKSVEYMGGADAVIARAREDFKAGNYRWVAKVMDQVVFADPGNKPARELAADAFEQMGYLAEAAPWRNAYLLAAHELRQGSSATRTMTPGITAEVLHAMTAGEMFDYLGTRIDGPKAGATKIVIAWRFTDTKEALTSTLQHGALIWIAGKTAANADANVTTTRAALEPVILGKAPLDQAGLKTVGNAKALSDLWALLVNFQTGFPMLAPT